MSERGARALLVLAEAAARNSVERVTTLAAAASEVAGSGLVLVGGAAANLHTGVYRPTDIDLVGHLSGSTTLERLRRLGFHKRRRHWEYRFADDELLAIEVVASALFELAADEPLRLAVGESTLSVISLNDLMMDRLLQATGGEPITFEEAVRLAIATYERIEWRVLARRITTAAQSPREAYRMLPGLLERVRRAARRELRTAELRRRHSRDS